MQREFGLAPTTAMSVLVGPAAAENQVEASLVRVNDLVPIIADGLRGESNRDATSAAIAVAEIYHRVEWAQPITETVQLLRALMRTEFEVAILANGPAEVAESLIPALLGDAAPSTVVASGTHGVRKPKPAAFKAVAHALGVPLDACFFIDDTLMHVEGARAVGMQSFHYQHDFEELESALHEAGVRW